MSDWNNKFNSELTTIKNRSFIAGWIQGFIAAAAIAVVCYMSVH